MAARTISLVLLALVAAALTIQVGAWVTTRHIIATVEESAQAEETGRINIVGTLTYWRNNMGREVPYVVYQPQRNLTVTKALLFDSASFCRVGMASYPCPLIGDTLRYYYAGEVSVEGVLVGEHVLVKSMSGMPPI